MEYLFHFAQHFTTRRWSFIRRAFGIRTQRPAATRNASRSVLKSTPVTSEPLAASPAETENIPPSTAGMTTKVVKGSLWTLAGQVAPLGVSLFATPFVIRLLGAEGYGVLILVSLIPTYLGFADLGMGLASTKFASEAYAAGDAEREARTVRTAAVIALCTSVPVAVLVFLLSGRLVTLFNVPEHLAWEASAALKVTSVTFVLNFLNQIFNTPQLTRLRMDLNTFVNSGFRILGIIATPIVIYLGGGILGAVIVLFAAALLTLGGHIYMSGRLLPPLFDISLDRNAIRPLLKFGGALGLAGIAFLLLNNVEKAIVTYVASPKELAYYSVAFTLAGMMTLLSYSIAQSLIPAFSRLRIADSGEFQALYSRVVRLLVICMMPIGAALLIGAKVFISLWAGTSFVGESTTPFYILLGGAMLYILSYVPSSALYAAGRSDLVAKLFWAELFLYLPLVWFLTNWLGISGAALAWSIRASVDAIVMFTLARLNQGVALPTKGLWRLSPALILMLLPVCIYFYFDWLMPFVAIAFLACLAGYVLNLWKWGLEAAERSWIRDRMVFGDRSTTYGC
ncbi:MAG: hypothetical protein DCC44_06665 [Acidobacteria bacterium]|nr:hypothetical protein [Pyrinomonadaceae bacterium]RIJ93511.1 MAG: hypothetical protein DCC44_06665 [Acidobacteriota bacterium]